MIILLLLLKLSLANASTCKNPFPLHVNEKVISACLKAEKIQKVGHLLFVQMPRAIYSDDQSSSSVTYFANTGKTRQKLCKIFKMKREMADYTLYDKSKSGIAYGRNGFTINKQANTLKMLACSIL